MESYDARKNTTEVRQGSRRTENLRVLLISGLALVALFAVIWAVFALGSAGGPAS